MADMHPHWQSTGGAPGRPDATEVNRTTDPVEAPSKESPTRIRVGGSAVSRKPAAVVGILTVLTILFTTLDRGETFQGQTGSPARSVRTKIEIRITDKGVAPKVVDVHQGQEIVWKNEQNIPHILESETLVSEDGETLYTTAIFSGSEESFILASNHQLGRHSYLSTTAIDVFGEINVLSGGAPKVTGAAKPSGQKTNAAEERIQPIGDPLLDGIFDDEDPQKKYPTPAAGTRVLPDNRPDTIDSDDPLSMGPGKSKKPGAKNDGSSDGLIPINPYKVGSKTAPPIGRGAAKSHAGAPRTPRPMKQPDTGPAVWVAELLSISGLFMVTKKYFSRVR